MRCSEFKDYLDDYCRGFLSDDKTQPMESHIASCELCAAEYQKHKSILSLLGNEPEQVIDPAELADFLPGVWERIEAKPRFSFKTWAFRLVPTAVITALLALMIFQPSIKNGTITAIDSLYNGNDYSALFPTDYFYSDQDTAYSDDTYYILLDDVLADDLELLELYEEELYSDASIFNGDSYGLEYLSNEGLEILDEKLEELINKTG